MLSLIVAVAENGVIGRGGNLPWRLSADLRRFKRLTMGHAILMGRKTWESIGRPLPGRKSIVISRQSDFSTGFDEVSVVADIEDAVLAANPAGSAEEVFVIGGAQIYEIALPRVDRLLITRVHTKIEGDAYFPAIAWDQWRLVEEEPHEADDRNDFSYSFQVFERVDG